MLLPILPFLLYAAIPGHSHVIDYRAVSAVEALVGHPRPSLQVCGTGPPTEHLVQAHANLRSDPEARLANQQVASSLVVQVYVHFVATKDQARHYSTATRNKVITNQV